MEIHLQTSFQVILKIKYELYRACFSMLIFNLTSLNETNYSCKIRVEEYDTHVNCLEAKQTEYLTAKSKNCVLSY